MQTIGRPARLRTQSHTTFDHSDQVSSNSGAQEYDVGVDAGGDEVVGEGAQHFRIYYEYELLSHILESIDLLTDLTEDESTILRQVMAITRKTNKEFFWEGMDLPPLSL